MTTKVTVTACCDANTTQVRVDVSGEPEAVGHILEDGDSQDFYVYDDRHISVREVKKNQEASKK